MRMGLVSSHTLQLSLGFVPLLSSPAMGEHVTACAPRQATQRDGQTSAGLHAEHTLEHALELALEHTLQRMLSTEAVTHSSSIPGIMPTTPIFSFPNYA